MTMAPAMAAAADVVGTLLGCGVTDFVVCPGARSQALALTVAALAESGDVRLHVRIDERSAGFLATHPPLVDRINRLRALRRAKPLESVTEA